MLITALIVFFIIFILNVCGFLGLRTVKHIRDIMPLSNGPLVSVVLVAKDKEEIIEDSIYQILHQTYENLEIIVVNDRSIDQTPTIIDRFSEQIKAVHVDRLPDGWLAKNYACAQGSKQATGEYILFIDTDTSLEATVIARAVGHMEDNDVDLLSVVYALKDTGILTKSLFFDNIIESLKIGFAWNCRQRDSKIAIANSKFNMFQHDLYKQSGGYESIPLCIAGDASIAALLKREYAKGDFIWGQDFVEVDCYKTPWELMVGSRKHLFSAMGFSLTTVIVLTILGFFLHVFPLVAVFITEGHTQVIFANIILIRVLMFLWESYIFGNKLYMPFYTLLTYPFSLASLWYSTWHILSRGGIEWAGKMYPIINLKNGMIFNIK